MTTVFLVIWLSGGSTRAAVTTIPMDGPKACEVAALAVQERRNSILKTALTYCIDPRTGRVWP